MLISGVMPGSLILAAAFVLGSCIGSFLNVCISRLPDRESIIFPGSRCPKCRNPIPFYDNIPVVSYLLLRGRCRRCGYAIPLRYPGVEILTGLMCAATVLYFGAAVDAVIYFAFICALIIIIFVDLSHRIIPDVISLPGIPAGFLASFVLEEITFPESLLGILIGGGILLTVALIYYLITGREGMGGGDIKLLAMIGAFIGWKGVIFTIFAASVTGTLAGILLMAAAGKDLRYALPFGPFLSAGAAAYIFLGPGLIAWYFYGIPLF